MTADHMKPVNSNAAMQAAITMVTGCTMPTANIHIDKIHIYAPCRHAPIGTQFFTYSEEFDEMMLAGATPKQKVSKKCDKRPYIRSRDIDETEMANTIEIHCCPPLVLQKHNLFGHGNLQDYVYAVLDRETKRLGIDVDPADRQKWRNGRVRLTEIHLTGNFGCPYSAILPIIQAIDDNNTCGKQRNIETCITLDGGKQRRSTFHATTIYDKMLELMYRWRKRGQYQSKLIEEARKGIRAEVKLRSDLIKQRKLGYVSDWKFVDVAELFFEIFNKYEINYSIQRRLTENELTSLDTAEKKAYLLWLAGVPIKDQGCRTTAWKYAKSIFDKTKVNIKGKRLPDALPDIDLTQIFRPENLLPIPAWVIGTPYFVPPARPSLFEWALRGIGLVDETERGLVHLSEKELACLY